MTDTTRAYSRGVPPHVLVEDPLFSDLYLQEPDLVKRIAASMRRDGFDPHRAIDVWKDGAGRGKHIVLEGHQRLAAAMKAGLTEVRVAYRDFPSRLAALLWANEQQAGRRNVNKEVQCLSLLQKLEAEDASFTTKTTKHLVAELKFSAPTIDRCRQLLKHGTKAEIMAVREGTHGLKQAYDLLRKRRGTTARAESAPVKTGRKLPSVVTALRNDLAKAIDGGLIENPEALRHARWLLDYLEGAGLPSEHEDDEDE
jgi:ParB-like chromosome segregation protein Spo0J